MKYPKLFEPITILGVALRQSDLTVQIFLLTKDTCPHI